MTQPDVSHWELAQIPGNSQLHSTLNLSEGYDQVTVAKHDQDKIAFMTKKVKHR